MRKIGAWLLMLALIFCIPSGMGEEEIPPAAGEGPLSARERILFYNQDITPEALENYPYNAIHCKSASYTVLGGNGCSLFAGLHAYQWLFGKFDSMEDQTYHAQQMVNLLYGESPAVQGNGTYVAHTYARENGARRVTDLRKTESAIKEFFDQKKGALYLHASWPHGGHYVIAVGYTYHEIDGKDTFLLHIVDSSWGAMLSILPGYAFQDFSPATVENGKHASQEYWMPLMDNVNIMFGLWVDSE